MRAQVKAYLWAHGTDPSQVDEETFRNICVMYSDGLIGNRMIIETLGNLTAGVYNYMRATGSTAYKLKDIINKTYNYFYPSQDSKETVNNSLIAYVSQAKGFDIKRFKADA